MLNTKSEMFKHPNKRERSKERNIKAKGMDKIKI